MKTSYLYIPKTLRSSSKQKRLKMFQNPNCESVSCKGRQKVVYTNIPHDSRSLGHSYDMNSHRTTNNSSKRLYLISFISSTDPTQPSQPDVILVNSFNWFSPNASSLELTWDTEILNPENLTDQTVDVSLFGYRETVEGTETIVGFKLKLSLSNGTPSKHVFPILGLSCQKFGTSCLARRY